MGCRTPAWEWIRRAESRTRRQERLSLAPIVLPAVAFVAIFPQVSSDQHPILLAITVSIVVPAWYWWTNVVTRTLDQRRRSLAKMRYILRTIGDAPPHDRLMLIAIEAFPDQADELLAALTAQALAA